MENNEYLEHYGRKGMKWGQNIFSAVKTYKTNKQRKANLEKARQAKVAKAEHEKAAMAGKISAKKMTTDELNKRIERLTLEKEYKNIMKDTSRVSKGKEIAMDILTKVGKDALEQTLAYGVETTINKVLFNGADAIDPKNIQNRRKQ